MFLTDGKGTDIDMKITWLGQAGLLFETDNIKIMIDPYFSNICEKYNPDLRRRISVRKEFTEIKPDVLVLTHNHLDHTDPETLPYFINDKTKVKIVLSENAHDFVKTLGGRTNDYIVFKECTEWTEGGVRFSGIKAYHSENTAFGIIIDDGEHKYYVTGDTLYNSNILKSLPDDIYAVFLPINGFGNNMNMTDAARFAKACRAKYTVPIHFGMFDSIDPKDFAADNKIILEVYTEIAFD